MSDGWILLGWIVVFGLPLAVVVAVIFWPDQVPPDRSVDGIRQRIEHEDRPPPAKFVQGRLPDPTPCRAPEAGPE
ncbi:hypothetical protein [Nocardia goodfellowii]|uniref:Uncharacterized protein n=1 Tax=Nocardia goodfellowii TaxID=882446 RepID=A0ABS4Q8V9_9NOCA|nr:hypothetical protein [Nocardia goodfellowii]MBP2188121.1 hypothetical protein [Nocardia goodfellowii]